jgi:3-oxoadipate enol-lactonase
MSQAAAPQMIEAAPGMRLAVSVTGVPDAPAIVLANSLASDMEMWTEVSALLAPHAKLVRYDTRGNGQSDAPSSGYSLDALTQDLAVLLDALALDKVVVCGLSLGGLTALNFARLAPKRVRGLVAANSAMHFPPAQMWRDRAALVLRQGMADMVEPTLARWFTPAFRAEAPERVAKIAAAIAATPPAGYAGLCGVLADADLRGTLGAIACPTLIIAGRQDPSTPPACSVEIAQAIPNAVLKELDAAHLSAVEAPQSFADAVLGFVRSL